MGAGRGKGLEGCHHTPNSGAVGTNKEEVAAEKNFRSQGGQRHRAQARPATEGAWDSRKRKKASSEKHTLKYRN